MEEFATTVRHAITIQRAYRRWYKVTFDKLFAEMEAEEAEEQHKQEESRRWLERQRMAEREAELGMLNRRESKRRHASARALQQRWVARARAKKLGPLRRVVLLGYEGPLAPGEGGAFSGNGVLSGCLARWLLAAGAQVLAVSAVGGSAGRSVSFAAEVSGGGGVEEGEGETVSVWAARLEEEEGFLGIALPVQVKNIPKSSPCVRIAEVNPCRSPSSIRAAPSAELVLSPSRFRLAGVQQGGGERARGARGGGVCADGHDRGRLARLPRPARNALLRCLRFRALALRQRLLLQLLSVPPQERRGL